MNFMRSLLVDDTLWLHANAARIYELATILRHAEGCENTDTENNG